MMNSPCRISLLLLLAGVGLHAAELPKPAPLTRYSGLWTSSPFTTKPPPPANAPEANIFEDLALKGIAPLANGGHLITLINRKNPAEITTIDTERPAASDYTFIKVERNSEKALGTIVHLSKNGTPGTVTYDDKLITPKAPVAKKPGPNVPGKPPAVAGQPVPPAPPNQSGPLHTGGRPRTVPPPTVGAQPGAQPAVQPGGAATAPGTRTNNRGNPTSTHQRTPHR
jgi:hypothetical protein